MGKSEHTIKLMLCDIVCIMYVYLSKTYSCLVLGTSRPREKRKERERVLPYSECLRGLVSVLGESRGRRIKEEARVGARRAILASQA